MEIKEIQSTLTTQLKKALKLCVFIIVSVITFIKNIQRSFVIKVLLVTVLVLFMGAVYSLQDADDVPLSEIDKALKKETRIEKMEECSERQLMQLIGIDASAYDSFIYYKSKKALGVDELLIVKANNRADLDGVQDAVDKRISNQIATFQGYGPEQVAMLKDAIITKRGNYLFYCVASNPEQYEEVFKYAV